MTNIQLLQKEILEENTISFNTYGINENREVMKITKDGIYVDSNVEVNEAAKIVIKCLEDYIVNLIRPLKEENEKLKIEVIQLKEKLHLYTTFA